MNKNDALFTILNVRPGQAQKLAHVPIPYYVVFIDGDATGIPYINKVGIDYKQISKPIPLDKNDFDIEFFKDKLENAIYEGKYEVQNSVKGDGEIFIVLMGLI